MSLMTLMSLMTQCLTRMSLMKNADLETGSVAGVAFSKSTGNVDNIGYVSILEFDCVTVV